MWIWHPHEALKGFPDTHYNWIIIYGESEILLGHCWEVRAGEGIPSFWVYLWFYSCRDLHFGIQIELKNAQLYPSRVVSAFQHCSLAVSITYKGIGQQPQILLNNGGFEDAGTWKFYYAMVASILWFFNVKNGCVIFFETEEIFRTKYFSETIHNFLKYKRILW